MSPRLSRADIDGMDPDEIASALSAGELGHLLNPASVTAADLRDWDAADVVAARDEGRLTHLGVEPEPVVAAPVPDADQGARGRRYGSMREQLRDSTPAEVAAKLAAGDLDALLRGEVE